MLWCPYQTKSCHSSQLHNVWISCWLNYPQPRVLLSVFVAFSFAQVYQGNIYIYMHMSICQYIIHECNMHTHNVYKMQYAEHINDTRCAHSIYPRKCISVNTLVCVRAHTQIYVINFQELTHICCVCTLLLVRKSFCMHVTLRIWVCCALVHNSVHAWL